MVSRVGEVTDSPVGVSDILVNHVALTQRRISKVCRNQTHEGGQGQEEEDQKLVHLEWIEMKGEQVGMKVVEDVGLLAKGANRPTRKVVSCVEVVGWEFGKFNCWPRRIKDWWQQALGPPRSPGQLAGDQQMKLELKLHSVVWV